MNRSLAPLTRKRLLGDAEVSFPLTLRSALSTAGLVPAPRRAVGALLGSSALRPVPVTFRGAGLLVQHTLWTETPVGPFSEVAIFALAYNGWGSPVPGLAPLLHGLTDRTQIVGDFGYVPVTSVVDEPRAVAFREDLWHVPVSIASIRHRRTSRSSVVQVDDHDEPVLRLAVRGDPRPGPSTRRTTVPVFGHQAGVVWHDVGGVEYEQVARRYRLGGGHLALYGRGPFQPVATALGVTAGGGFVRRALAGEMVGVGKVRWQGPRPHDPDLDAPRPASIG